MASIIHVVEPSSDQQATDDRAVVLDLRDGALVMAGRRRELGPDPTNSVVLENYVTLVGECRGRRLDDRTKVREEDLDALSVALDLDVDRLVEEIEAVLVLSSAEAAVLVERLRTRRRLLAAAAVAAGLVVGGLTVAALASSPSKEPAGGPAPSTSAVVASTAGTEPEVTVGLIPAVSIEAPTATIIEGDATLIAPQSIGDDQATTTTR